jgi:hypothetical protein
MIEVIVEKETKESFEYAFRKFNTLFRKSGVTQVLSDKGEFRSNQTKRKVKRHRAKANRIRAERQAQRRK